MGVGLGVPIAWAAGVRPAGRPTRLPGAPERGRLSSPRPSGNCAVADATRNALRLLTLAGATDVPVAQGAAEPLSSELALANYVRGDSGLDGPELPEPAFKAVAEPAAEFNTYCDPEALDLVLHSDVPVRMVAGGLRRSGTPRALDPRHHSRRHSQPLPGPASEREGRDAVGRAALLGPRDGQCGSAREGSVRAPLQP